MFFVMFRKWGPENFSPQSVNRIKDIILRTFWTEIFIVNFQTNLKQYFSLDGTFNQFS